MATKNGGGDDNNILDGKVGDNNILAFLMTPARQKNATLENCILGNIFYSYL